MNPTTPSADAITAKNKHHQVLEEGQRDDKRPLDEFDFFDEDIGDDLGRDDFRRDEENQTVGKRRKVSTGEISVEAKFRRLSLWRENDMTF